MIEPVRPLRFFDDALELLDQTLLPGEEKWIRLHTPAEVIEAIQMLRVRGAPAIGCAGAYALVLAAGDAAAVREAQEEYLTTCDAIITFYGQGDEAWKRTIDNELKKIKGYRGDKPLLAHYTYLAEPADDDKEEMIEFEEPDLINGLEGFSEAEMDAFIQAVTQSQTASP